MVVGQRKEPTVLYKIQQPSVKCGLFRVSGIRHFSGSEVGVQYQHHLQKDTAEDVLSTVTAETWPTRATGHFPTLLSLNQSSTHLLQLGLEQQQDKQHTYRELTPTKAYMSNKTDSAPHTDQHPTVMLYSRYRKASQDLLPKYIQFSQALLLLL